MREPLSTDALDQLFIQARSHNRFTAQPVEDGTLRRLYALAAQGPTANNCCPARFVFVRTQEGRQRLLPALKGMNPDKVLSAPVTVIIAQDSRFFEELPRLFRAYDAATPLAANPAMAAAVGFRNASLQGAYLMLAARALGLDCGPMSGFDAAALDTEFFPDGRWRSNFLCAIGHGDAGGLYPKGPRLDFDAACRLA